MPTFLLIKSSDNTNSWWEKSNNYLLSYYGLLIKKELIDESRIIETTQANRFEDLDWFKTDLIKKDSRFGWLLPNGQFIGCYFTQHDDIARLIFKKEVHEIEQLGYARIGRSYESNKVDVVCMKSLTTAQKQFLKREEYEF